MGKRHPSYEAIKEHGPDEKFPICTALLRYWEHCENEHGATPEDFGVHVLGWHKKNFPTCESLPTYSVARKIW